MTKRGAGKPLVALLSTVSRDESEQGMRYGRRPNSAAAPATVSGEPGQTATGRTPGRRRQAETREPGDLPSMLVARRAGCLGAVGSLAEVPIRASAVMHPRSREAVRSDGQGDTHRHGGGRGARHRGGNRDDDLCLHHLPARRRSRGGRSPRTAARARDRARGARQRRRRAAGQLPRQLQPRPERRDQARGRLDLCVRRPRRDARRERPDRRRQAVRARHRRRDAVARPPRNAEARADRPRAAHRFLEEESE